MDIGTYLSPENESPNGWKVEIWNSANGRSPFGKWYAKLDPYDQAVVDTAIGKILVPLGPRICETEWGKPLKEGLYEFRIRRSFSTIVNTGIAEEEERQMLPSWAQKPVLLRIFCTFHGNRIVVLFQGYDKGKDPSSRRQEREIQKARKILRAWREETLT
ncbi:hypothetical protein GCM10009715_32190 [Paeniglutamicibacter psychrophenolicus]|uniref:Type II toxin-antitoxin system RelE/ParE family toxin n=1 Tax=Paeniglutamicibacter psychrophenolicus TaxID=257454 RepID=A0ABS4W9C4_9MICC|nr:hypothetical protein [Paeniglutamicibacter psychrophenolicus]MBP2372807.1 hypothetical protein [Paeniglutamicibacter psychrophenolicus]